jgi:bifunctional UDP-N-acetylglucosamine pyrophosphorylase/glucosamine-1-phosphate N-acetyltransferase
MLAGVTIMDPATTYIDDTVMIGPDTVVYPNAVIDVGSEIGSDCVVGAGCQIRATTIGDRVRLKPYCVLTESTIEDEAVMGPFCHLRPKSHVGAGAEIGNFIELKKARVGRRSKAHHVGYLGDVTIGDGANIGAGTIFVNYDGAAKHHTSVGDGAFVGSNSSIVAPLTIGPGAYVAAGSVITKDVPADALVVERSAQVVKEGWAARRRAKREADKKKDT